MTWIDVFMVEWFTRTMAPGAYQDPAGLYVCLPYTSLATFTAQKTPPYSKRLLSVHCSRGLYLSSTIVDSAEISNFNSYLIVVSNAISSTAKGTKYADSIELNRVDSSCCPCRSHS